jgi:hypothetical protein
MKQLKHLRQTLWRALLCLTVAITCWGSASAYNFVKGSTLYFKISNTSWNNAGAWFAANFNDGNPDGDNYKQRLTHLEGDYYSFEVPRDSWNLQLLRMDKDATDIFGNVWGRTNNFGAGAQNGQNCLALEGSVHDNQNLSWTTYNNGGEDVANYDVYIGGSWMSGQNNGLSSVTEKIAVINNAYNPYVATTTSGNAKFRFYQKSASDGLGNWISPSSDYTFTDDDLKGTKEFSTVGDGKTYSFKDAGTYEIQVISYNGDATVKFTVLKKEGGEDIPVTLPALYIGGSYKGGNSNNPAQIPGNVTTGKYEDYTIVVTATNQNFCFYDKNKNKIGFNGNGDWKVIVNDHCTGTYEMTAQGGQKVYYFVTLGTYKISVKEYNESAKTVKFTMTYEEPEKHLYLGATFKGNLISPDFQLDNNDKYAPVRFTKNSNDGDFKFRFSNKEGGAADVDWIGPSNDETINLSTANNKGEYTIGKSSKVYTIKNNGVYELQVTKWDKNFNVDFTLTYVEEVDNDTPYYFVGDLNDWYSTEFDQPNGKMSMQKFLNERDAWKFRKATEKDLEGVESEYMKNLSNLDGWYVFDSFPVIEDAKTLSGEFQITSGGTDNLWNAQVFSLGVNNVVDASSNMDTEKAKTVLMNPIKEDDILFGKKFDLVHGRFKNTPAVAFSNFHLQCNAVKNAKIFFKPGTEDQPGSYNSDGDDWYNRDSKFEGSEIVVAGQPKNYYIFYAYKESEATDSEKQSLANKPSGKEIKAKINTGKPNSNNYFLPGINYSASHNVVPSIGIDGNTIEHMNVNGVYLNELKHFKNSESETTAYLKGLADLDADVADMLIQNGTLPNGRSVGDFDRLFYVRIPAGFENPAGWKYNLGLQEAIYNVDLEKSVAIACNHIYFMPGIDGVSVHLNDDKFKNGELTYIEHGEKKTIDLSDYDIHYYYRIYYSKPTSNNNYEIRVVDHMAGNTLGEDKVIYSSGVDTRKNTLDETGDARDFGWKSLNAHTSAEAANATLADGSNDKLRWDHLDGNNTEFKDASDNWHITLVESSDKQMRRLRIPQAHSNAYVQILAVFYSKENEHNPYNKARKSIVSRDGNVIETTDGESVADAIDHADRISIEPGALTFENDRYHHPLQGNHLYYALDNNYYVWTGVEEIEDNLIVDAEDVNVNAAPVYYNLQGVRVAAPTKGIFIEVRGNKSRKVVY